MKYPKSYDISKNSEGSIEDKLRLVDGYNIRDLLYIYQDVTKSPEEFDDKIIIHIMCRLYSMGFHVRFIDELLGKSDDGSN